MSSGSKARQPSDRNGPKGGGSARSTEEAEQCPWREGAEQDSLFGESNTAAPEADKTVSTKLAGLVARARKEARLTNAVQYVDEELLRLAFGSLRKQAAPGVDGQSYENYAASLDQNLKDLHVRLKSGRYQAPVIRRVYIPKANGKRRPLGITTIEDRVVQKAVAWILSAVADAHSTSGGIDLIGDFGSSAQIASVSGSVRLRFTPATSIHIDATSISGDVSAGGLSLTGQTTGPHSLSGNIANGGPTVSVHTTSGTIRLLPGS